jgi:hypothetical protein
MPLLSVFAFFDVAVFAFALCAFVYLFNRFSGQEDTNALALTMHEINTVKPATEAAKAKARAAGAA